MDLLVLYKGFLMHKLLVPQTISKTLQRLSGINASEVLIAEVVIMIKVALVPITVK